MYICCVYSGPCIYVRTYIVVYKWNYPEIQLTNIYKHLQHLQHLHNMDIQRALHNYIERMVTETDGMKVLLVDNETVLFLWVVMDV